MEFSNNCYISKFITQILLANTTSVGVSEQTYYDNKELIANLPL